MAEYQYTGHDKRVWPGHPHPEQDGVLVADPDEIVDFGEALPPADGSWYDVSSGDQYTGAPPPDVEADEHDADLGTGNAAEDQED